MAEAASSPMKESTHMPLFVSFDDGKRLVVRK
jgi:hypothetical protein